MGLPKGRTNNPAGKKKGVQNKVTAEIKEAFKHLIELNLENMTIWLERVAISNPDRALDLIIKLSEYIIPKLARTEIRSDKEDSIEVKIDFIGNSVNDKT